MKVSLKQIIILLIGIVMFIAGIYFATTLTIPNSIVIENNDTRDSITTTFHRKELALKIETMDKRLKSETSLQKALIKLQQEQLDSVDFYIKEAIIALK